MTWRTRRQGQRRRFSPWPYLFLTPFAVVFAGFFLLPMVQSVAMSFRVYSGPRLSRSVGWSQYRFLLSDPFFWIAVANTLSYTLLFLLVQVPMSLGLAVLLNGRRIAGRPLLRLAFLLPFLTGNVVTAVLFTWLASPRSGLLVRAWSLVDSAGAADLNFLTDPVLATLIIVLAVAWLTVGWGMVYLLAALQAVDPQQYEAATIDGASGVRRFWHVTLPGVRPVLNYLILVGVINGLQLFELPYLYFQGLGPKLRGLTILQYLVLRGFDRGDLGLAAAVGWVLVLLIVAVTLPQVRRLSRGGAAAA